MIFYIVDYKKLSSSLTYIAKVKHQRETCPIQPLGSTINWFKMTEFKNLSFFLI